jgi:hypothetical protein
MTRLRIFADPLAAGATCLLLVVVLWRAALSIWLPAPLRASEVLPAAASIENSTGRVLVLVEADKAQASDAPAAARRTWPKLPVEVHGLGHQSGGERLRRLATAYGYDRLPVAILVDLDGRVLRVAAL